MVDNKRKCGGLFFFFETFVKCFQVTTQVDFLISKEATSQKTRFAPHWMVTFLFFNTVWTCHVPFLTPSFAVTTFADGFCTWLAHQEEYFVQLEYIHATVLRYQFADVNNCSLVKQTSGKTIQTATNMDFGLHFPTQHNQNLGYFRRGTQFGTA